MSLKLNSLSENPLILISVWAGLISGVFAMVFISILHLLHVPLFDGLTNLSFVVNALITIVAILNFRNRNNNNELRFWQGLLISFIVFIVSSLVLMLLLSVYLGFIFPSYLSESITLKLEWLELNKALFLKDIKEEGFKNICEIFRKTSAVDVALSKVNINLMATFVYGIILSIIFRK